MLLYTVKVGLAVQIMSRYTGRGLQNLIREAESTDDRMSDSSDSDITVVTALTVVLVVTVGKATLWSIQA